ncbi:MAG TPA: hypothetical protein ENO21_04220, partial [Firmicutes bacterium]|nr:hypothetical protein [Bacillota bacterium]
MRTIGTLVLSCLIAASICLPSVAAAYERPGAVSLAGEWEFCPVEPVIDIVPDRYTRPDWPTLCPEWDEVIDPEASPPWDSDWHPVPVPMAWEHYTNAGYNEAGWYARYVDIPREWMEDGKRIWLEFDAVATAAGV